MKSLLKLCLFAQHPWCKVKTGGLVMQTYTAKPSAEPNTSIDDGEEGGMDADELKVQCNGSKC